MLSQRARLRVRFEFQKNKTIDQRDFISSRDTNHISAASASSDTLAGADAIDVAAGERGDGVLEWSERGSPTCTLPGWGDAGSEGAGDRRHCSLDASCTARTEGGDAGKGGPVPLGRGGSRPAVGACLP